MFRKMEAFENNALLSVLFSIPLDRSDTSLSISSIVDYFLESFGCVNCFNQIVNSSKIVSFSITSGCTRYMYSFSITKKEERKHTNIL